MSKAYLVFETVNHEAHGGFDDFAMSTNHMPLAEAFVKQRGRCSEAARDYMNRWQIVEIITGQPTGHPGVTSGVSWSIIQRGEYPND